MELATSYFAVDLDGEDSSLHLSEVHGSHLMKRCNSNEGRNCVSQSNTGVGGWGGAHSQTWLPIAISPDFKSQEPV